jgi:hypothetical protein
MAAISGANIVTDGLIFYIDPSNPNSVSGIGTSIYNLANLSEAGTFVGYTSNPIDNTENRSIIFDGNDYINIPSGNFIYGTAPRTMMAWSKISANDGSTHASFAYGNPASNQAFFIGVYGLNPFCGAWANDLTASNTTIAINTWFHTACVFDGTTAYLYVAGISTTSATKSWSTLNVNRAYLGRQVDNGQYWNGNIGQALIYNRALSAAEILQYYNATKKEYSPEENIITSGLIYNIDASKNASYPGIGTTIYDLSGIGNTGTLTNGPTFSSLNSGSLVFDGTNDFINLPNANLLTFGTSPFSIEFWMYSTYVYPGSGTLYKTILSNYSDYNGDFGSYFYLGLFNLNNSTLQNKVGVLDHTGNFLDFSFSVTVAPNQWTHITLTRNGSSFSWYKDGTLQISSSVASNNFSGVRTSKFGGGVSSVGTFTGSLPLLRIYNKTLSAQEVLQNYNATKNRYINVLPPVNDSLILNLDAGNRASYAGTGTTWYDLSGNNLNGTLINGPTYSGTGTSTIITTDGTDDYIEVLDNSLLDFGANNFTVEYWFKKLSTTTGYDNIWGVNKWNVGGGGAGTNEWALEIGQGSSGTGDFVAFAVESGSTTYVTSYFNLTNALTQYHQLVGIRNGNKLELYLDGSQLYSNTPAGFTTSVSVNNISGRNLRIANAALNNLYTNTSSAVVRIYSKALSSTEILQNFNFYRSRYGI